MMDIMPIKVASGIIEKAGAILLLKRSRKNGHFKGYWQLPEGKIERGEAPLGALRRELQEEIGHTITVHHRVGVIRMGIPVDGRPVTIIRTLFLVDKPVEIHLSSEHSAFRWVAMSHMTELSLYPGTSQAIKKYLSYKLGL